MGWSQYKSANWYRCILWCQQSVSTLDAHCITLLDIKINEFLFIIIIFNYSFESNENVVITCSTKVCSFGKQVVEKVETEYSRLENGRFVYRIHRSPMCDYMINFINKLKRLPEKYMMNSVLENFTILQVSIWNFDAEDLVLILWIQF